MNIEPIVTFGNSDWYVKDRFGMFIHWGLYATPARHEWIKSYEKQTDEHYDKYFKYFEPDMFSPDDWAELAAETGMKYMVITTKHHEGFCLWDTKYTDFNSTNTSYGKDILQEVVTAFRKKEMKIGLYHSLLDWHHPDYTIDERHPMRDLENTTKLNESRNMEVYTEYLHSQVEELLSNYGDISVLWFDFSVVPSHRYAGKGKEAWKSEELIKKVRALQPEILINDRLEIDQDIKTPEQYQPSEWYRYNGKRVLWEACHTFSGAWGYHRDQQDFKSSEVLIKMLIDTVSKGGNFLLNVGPNARGEIDPRAVERLKEIGSWMKYHHRSIYGCTEAPHKFKAPQDCRFTFNPETNRLYLHIFSWPFAHLQIAEIAEYVEFARLLSDGSELKMIKGERPKDYTAALGEASEITPDSTLTLDLPTLKPNVTVPVVEIMLNDRWKVSDEK